MGLTTNVPMPDQNTITDGPFFLDTVFKFSVNSDDYAAMEATR